MRLLNIWVDQQRAGVVYENQGIWSLKYERSWVEQGFELSPGLPLQAEEIIDSGTNRPVQWFFDNLLPEDIAREKLISSLPRGEWNAWTLLTRYGSESAGALTLLPNTVSPDLASYLPLTSEGLEFRIRNMPKTPLIAAAPKKMSLAGAQDKLLVCIDAKGNLFEPVGSAASTHILKPDAVSAHYPCSAANEWFCAKLASKLKLPVPQVELRHVPSSIYLIERFDRKQINGETHRLHAIDGAQMLNLGASAKYSEAGVQSLKKLIDYCRIKAQARVRIFEWALFNVLIGNADAHLKNVSLLSGRDGYAIAQHYDLVSTATWATKTYSSDPISWPHIPMSFQIGDAITFEEITRKDLIAFGQALGVPTTTIDKTIDRFVGQIQVAGDEVISEYESKSVRETTRASELRMLRTIRHISIADMCQRLAR